MKRRYVIFLVLSISVLLFAAGTIPVSTGFMVYHSYSDYGAWDSRMFLLNLENGDLDEISKSWNIDHAMNGHISPDGTKLVFMGDDQGEPRDWDIYLWEIGSVQSPVNLTNGYNKRDEDPKFSPDGTRIVFKQAYWSSAINDFVFDLKEMNLSGEVINIITSYDRVEESMPYYTADGQRVIYASGGGSSGDIHMMNTDGTDHTALEISEGIQEYYPIVRDSATFFFTKWVSSSDHHDQVYLGYLNGDPATSVAFNIINADNSDAYPAGPDLAFYSSTRSGGEGAYDLYLGDINTGDVWSLDNLANVNSMRNELGACYSAHRLVTGTAACDLKKDPLYPNPSSSGVFYLNTDKSWLLRVVDINGMIIMENVIHGSAPIDLSDRGRGVYFFMLQSADEWHTLKAIVE
ncbi:MAG: T9SS type A sorting domain-containing protein [Bacteroidota bacterium]